MKNILYNEINIRVGQNAKENDYLVRNSHPEFTRVQLKSYIQIFMSKYQKY